MESWKRLLLANQAFVEEKLSVRPDYFTEMAKGQSPEFLWIGCSDSRVPAETITGTSPGELFVHRNIANLVVHTDFNIFSVLNYAVDHLKVKQVIVCGHYGCGGVNAALSNTHFGLLNNWLRNIKDVYDAHQDEVHALKDPDARSRRMVELNVLAQVRNLVKTSTIQRAWAMRDAPVVHGWVYGLDDGRIHALTKVDPRSDVDSVYRYDFRPEDLSGGV